MRCLSFPRSFGISTPHNPPYPSHRISCPPLCRSIRELRSALTFAHREIRWGVGSERRKAHIAGDGCQQRPTGNPERRFHGSIRTPRTPSASTFVCSPTRGPLLISSTLYAVLQIPRFPSHFTRHAKAVPLPFRLHYGLSSPLSIFCSWSPSRCRPEDKNHPVSRR
ncbi:hypothetical protein Hypma_003119, partial [Hypsizygus marmoreus]